LESKQKKLNKNISKKDEQKVIDLAVAIKKHLGKKITKQEIFFIHRVQEANLVFKKVQKIGAFKVCD